MDPNRHSGLRPSLAGRPWFWETSAHAAMRFISKLRHGASSVAAEGGLGRLAVIVGERERRLSMRWAGRRLRKPERRSMSRNRRPGLAKGLSGPTPP